MKATIADLPIAGRSVGLWYFAWRDAVGSEHAEWRRTKRASVQCYDKLRLQQIAGGGICVYAAPVLVHVPTGAGELAAFLTKHAVGGK